MIKRHYFGMIPFMAGLILIASLAGCTNVNNDNGDEEPLLYEVGDTGPGGGKIFYKSVAGFTMTDTNKKAHYLEAAPADMVSTLAWASASHTGTNIAGTGTAIGSGRKNTTLILAIDTTAPAAKACDVYVNGGKDDWFLPSKDELNQLYVHSALFSNLSPDTYWSSSQDNENTYMAWYQFFATGGQGNDGSKNTASPVRAIRAF